MKKRIISLTLAILMVIGITGCSQKPTEEVATENTKIRFVLDWTPNTNHTGVYVALAQGYYEEAGLDVEIIQPPEDGATSAVGSGNAEFGVDFQESLAYALDLDNPFPVTAVAGIINHNTSGLISLKEKGIDSFDKLEGKTYATWDMPAEQAIIKEVMEAQGGDYSKLNMVPHSGADAISLMNSDVDAVWVYEGWDMQMAELEGVEYNYISFAEAAPVLDFYTPVIIGNNEFLKNNPEKAKAFLAATAKGYEFAIANPEEAAKILVEMVPELSYDLVLKSQEYLAEEYTDGNQPWGLIDSERWNNFYNWMYENQLITRDITNKGFSNDFLPNP